MDEPVVIVASLCLCLFLGGAGAWGMSRLGCRWGLVDLPGDRNSHSLPTPRGGGIGIVLAFGMAAAFFELSPAFWAPAVFLSVVSFLDDRLDLSPRTRLLFQFAAAVILVAGTGQKWGWWEWPFMLTFWSLFVVGTANFYNFMDGINGIAGITAVLGYSMVAFFAHLTGVEDFVYPAAGVALAALGFLPFNMPRALVFMGDVGSILLGFVYAALVFRLTGSPADFLCLVVFIFPFYADALTTLYIRWRDGENFAKAHRRHLYQVMANELALPHWRVSLGYGAVQLFFGLLMLGAWRLGLVWQILLLGLFSVAFVAYQSRVRNAAMLAV